MRTTDIESGRSKNNYFAKRRLRLMQKDPHCHWCRRELKSYPNRTRGKLPADFPTIDHLTSKFLCPRRDTRMRKTTLVLACQKCNTARQKEEHAKHIWLTRWKSGMFPYPFRWFGAFLKFCRREART